MQAARHKHGAIDPETGLRFWGYQGGKKYWVTADKYAALTARALEKKRLRYKENPDKYREERRQYRANNIERCLAAERVYDARRKACPRRREQVRLWLKRYKATNPSFDLSIRMRIRLANALARQKATKNGSLEQLLGCEWADFTAHIERQFVEGMSWGNRHLWHIDHIKPCCAFDLTQPNEQAACFHYTNLRPLWAKDNLRKNGKYLC